MTRLGTSTGRGLRESLIGEGRWHGGPVSALTPSRRLHRGLREAYRTGVGFMQPPGAPQPPSRPGARSQVLHTAHRCLRSRSSLCARGAVERRVTACRSSAREGAGSDLLYFLSESEPGGDERCFLRSVADEAGLAVETRGSSLKYAAKAALEARQRLAPSAARLRLRGPLRHGARVETARELLPDDPGAPEPLAYADHPRRSRDQPRLTGLSSSSARNLWRKRVSSLRLEKQAAAHQARHGTGSRPKWTSSPRYD